MSLHRCYVGKPAGKDKFDEVQQISKSQLFKHNRAGFVVIPDAEGAELVRAAAEAQKASKSKKGGAEKADAAEK